MKPVFLFLVAVARVGAWALAGILTAMLTLLGWLGWMIEASRDTDDRIANFWTGDSNDGYDQVGGTLTPGEEGASMVRRKRWL